MRRNHVYIEDHGRPLMWQEEPRESWPQTLANFVAFLVVAAMVLIALCAR